AGSAATLLYGSGSTQDEEPDATELSFHGRDAMTENQDDEIPLGYLQPSSKPGSIGRLGHYEIHEVLGRGAFGTVLKAFDEKLHRVVAIKVLAPEIAATSPARKRFLREAQASAAIRHEHVVSIYAVEESPIPYLVMEYIPGLTLQQRLDERGPLDVPTVLKLGRQIAEGLAGAHAQDLIHRDIKPGNILLETSVHDRVKITDFGLARAADDASLTQSGTIAGTPMYMAPEQALGHKLDQRADLFSLGSVLYQMVSGRPPFRANGTLAVLKRVTEDTPRPISEIIPETPAWLCAIITKLHAKNPDERYQTAQEIADVLANCESQLKTHSGLKDFSLIPRAKAQPAGWWRWMAVAALVLPLLAFGLYAFTRPAAHPTVAGNGIKTSTLDPIKPDSELLPDQVTQQGIPASDGWVQLFNGQDLTGWKNDDDHWTIENGMLVTRLPKGAVKTSGFLQTVRKDYRDFHIRAEVKINEGGDSGLFVRFGEQGDVSLQAQITTDPGSVGSLLRHAATIVPGSHSVLADTWFTLEVIAQGPRVAVFVDGHEAAT
ncbi:MAG: protein kinase, partial [Candidatus Saccharimonas sp.]|nr:protein kinase [Planctomycetaceae bacterium]